MDVLRRILAVFLFATSFPLLSYAQSVHAFNWGFGKDFIQTSFAECESHAINLIPLNSSTTYVGQPPYYMTAYAIQNTTIVSLLGDDPSNLSWQVQHARGSQLLLTVVDSLGQTGGFTNQFYNVTAGQDSSCVAPPPSDPAVATSNITASAVLNTCDPWGITITGGQKPYNVSLAAVNAPVVTNVTMGPQDDVFTFIDRADPGTQILAAVVDATGQWGISTIAVKTGGPTDTTCIGLGSTSKTSAEIKAEAVAAAAAQAAAASAAAKAKSTATALGIVFGLILPLILGGVGFWWWRRRKNQRQNARPRPFDPGMQERGVGRPSLNLDTNVVHITSQGQRTASWVVDSRNDPVNRSDSPTSIDMSSTDLNQSSDPTPYLTSSHVMMRNSSIMPSPASMQLPPSAVSRSISMARSPVTPPSAAALSPMTLTPNSTSPAATLTPGQRYRKALEAHAEAQAARARVGSGASTTLTIAQASAAMVAGPSNSGSATGGRPSMQRSQSAAVMRAFPQQPLPRRAGSSLRMPPGGTIDEVGPDIIFQHRDGGRVEELPPPYPADASPRYPGTPAPPLTPRVGVGAGSVRSPLVPLTPPSISSSSSSPPQTPPASTPVSPQATPVPPPPLHESPTSMTPAQELPSVVSVPRPSMSPRQRPPLGAGVIPRRRSAEEQSQGSVTDGS